MVLKKFYFARTLLGFKKDLNKNPRQMSNWTSCFNQGFGLRVSILIHQYHFKWCTIYGLNRQIKSTSSTHPEKHLYQIVYGIGKPEMKYEKTESANAIYLTYRLSITVHGICATYNKILSYTNLSYIFIYLPIVLQAIVCKSNIERSVQHKKY